MKVNRHQPSLVDLRTAEGFGAFVGSTKVVQLIVISLQEERRCIGVQAAGPFLKFSPFTSRVHVRETNIKARDHPHCCSSGRSPLCKPCKLQPIPGDALCITYFVPEIG